MPKAQEPDTGGPGRKSQLHHLLQGLLLNTEGITATVWQDGKFDKETEEAGAEAVCRKHALYMAMVVVAAGVTNETSNLNLVHLESRLDYKDLKVKGSLLFL